MKESYQSPEGRPTALLASLIASGTALTDGIGMDLGADSLERACVNGHHKRAALSSLGRGIASTRDSVVDDLVVIADVINPRLVALVGKTGRGTVANVGHRVVANRVVHGLVVGHRRGGGSTVVREVVEVDADVVVD